MISALRWMVPFLREKPIELQQAHRRVARRMAHRADEQADDTPAESGLSFLDTLPMEPESTWMSSQDFLEGVEVTAVDVEVTASGIEETHPPQQEDTPRKPTEISRGADVEIIQNGGEIK